LSGPNYEPLRESHREVEEKRLRDEERLRELEREQQERARLERNPYEKLKDEHRAFDEKQKQEALRQAAEPENIAPDADQQYQDRKAALIAEMDTKVLTKEEKGYLLERFENEELVRMNAEDNRRRDARDSHMPPNAKGPDEPGHDGGKEKDAKGLERLQGGVEMTESRVNKLSRTTQNDGSVPDHDNGHDRSGGNSRGGRGR